MVDEPQSLTFDYLRRFDTKLDRVVDDLRDLKVRMTSMDEGLTGANRRLDRVEFRLDRVEKRLDLVEPPH